MQVTEELNKEHQLILTYLDIMEGIAKTPETPILMEKAPGFISFLREFADHFHHAKEEAILFRYLEAPNVLTHCNPVPQMLIEHAKSRELVNSMETAMQTKNVAAFATAIFQYSSLLKEHIYKEDDILYPMAERGLSDESKLLILAEYAQANIDNNSLQIWQKYEEEPGEIKSVGAGYESC